MDNQHQKIKGYRDLTQAEIDLMNRIKEHEVQTMDLLREVRTKLVDAEFDAAEAKDAEEVERIRNAEPFRWASIARTDFQTGFMALVRAVAQPVTP